MRRRAQTCFAIGITTVLSFCAPVARAGPSLGEDLATLNNPRAGSAEKLDAARRFPTRALTPAEKRDAARALARQSFFDVTAVRDAAIQSLIHLDGPDSANRTRAEFIAGRTLFDAFAVDWVLATRRWKAAREIRDIVTAPRLSHSTDRAVIAMISQAAAGESGAIGELDDDLRDRLIAHLSAIDVAEPSNRAAIIRLVELIGPKTPAAVPLLFRWQVGDDPKIAAVAQRLAKVTFANIGSRDDLIAPVADALIGADKKIIDIATRAAADVPAQALERHLASAILLAIARDKLPPLAVSQRKIPARTLAAVAYPVLLSVKTSQRGPVLDALREAGAGAELENVRNLHDFLIKLLTQDDGGGDAIRARAAHLLITSPARAVAVEFLVDHVASGRSLSPVMLEALAPDPEALGEKLLTLLRGAKPGVGKAALEALGVVGMKNPKFRSHLTALLRSPDDGVRHAAANALDTPEAQALASVPDVVKDIRDDDFNTRQRAAHRLHRLNIERPEVTAALIRAVESRDMPAREGLLLAIERGFDTTTPATEILKSAAQDDPDPARRIYAKAALREIGSMDTQKEAPR